MRLNTSGESLPLRAGCTGVGQQEHRSLGSFGTCVARLRRRESSESVLVFRRVSTQLRVVPRDAARAGCQMPAGLAGRRSCPSGAACWERESKRNILPYESSMRRASSRTQLRASERAHPALSTGHCRGARGPHAPSAAHRMGYRTISFSRRRIPVRPGRR